MARHAQRGWALLAMLAALAGCQKLPSGGGSVVPTPTPTASYSPGPCGTLAPDTTNLVLVAMGGAINPVSDPTYGKIGGYVVVSSDGSVPSQASIINETPDGTPITAANTLQFVNVEPPGAPVDHSAYGFKGGFPVAPFAFPSPAPSPTGTTVYNGPWFTGEVPSLVSTACYSQVLTLRPGTYYFGDYDYYNLGTFRDVLLVSASSTRSSRSRHAGHRFAPGMPTLRGVSR